MKLKALSENFTGKHSMSPWLETVQSDCARGALTSIMMNGMRNSMMEKSSFQQNCIAENVLSREKY